MGLYTIVIRFSLEYDLIQGERHGFIRLIYKFRELIYIYFKMLFFIEMISFKKKTKKKPRKNWINKLKNKFMKFIHPDLT